MKGGVKAVACLPTCLPARLPACPVLCAEDDMSPDALLRRALRKAEEEDAANPGAHRVSPRTALCVQNSTHRSRSLSLCWDAGNQARAGPSCASLSCHKKLGACAHEPAVGSADLILPSLCAAGHAG